MSTIYKVQVCMLTTSDNFENGQNPDTTQDMGAIESLEFKTLDEVLKYAETYGEVYIFDNRLEVQRNETTSGEIPSSKELEEFKSGKIDMLTVDYSFYIEKHEITELDNSSLAAAFNHLENMS